MGALYTNNPKKSSNITAALFLSAYTCYTDTGSSADKQQCDPQHEIAVISGFGRLLIVGQFCRYGIGFGYFFVRRRIAVILVTILAIPVFDVTIRTFCYLFRDVYKVWMALCIKLAVGFSADSADCFILTGRLSADVIGQYIPADIADVVVVGINAFAERLTAVIALVIFVFVCAFAKRFAAIVALVIFVFVRAFAERLTAVIALVIFIFVRAFAKHLTAVIALVILIFVRAFAERHSAVVALVIFVFIRAFAERLIAVITDVVFVGVHMIGYCLVEVVADVVFISVGMIRKGYITHITLVVFIPVGSIVRFGVCTAVHRASAGVGTVAV